MTALVRAYQATFGTPHLIASCLVIPAAFGVWIIAMGVL